MCDLQYLPESLQSAALMIWLGTPMEYDTINSMFHMIVDGYRDKLLSGQIKLPEHEREAAIQYALKAVLHGLRSTVPSLGAEREHKDRAIRFQGWWSKTSDMDVKSSSSRCPARVDMRHSGDGMGIEKIETSIEIEKSRVHAKKGPS